VNLIEATVQGIPCLVRVTHFSPGRPGRYHGPAEDCFPDEDPEFSYDILDRRGRPAPWLARKATDADHDRICELIEENAAQAA